MIVSRELLHFLSNTPRVPLVCCRCRCSALVSLVSWSCLSRMADTTTPLRAADRVESRTRVASHRHGTPTGALGDTKRQKGKKKKSTDPFTHSHNIDTADGNMERVCLKEWNRSLIEMFDRNNKHMHVKRNRRTLLVFFGCFVLFHSVRIESASL